jgi:D-alanyl-D-alanine carboxypeptidase/D-alanyl-D-alanine-endopeptidase (penicillin-binding protein 4)
MPEFIASLPLAGVDGTMRKRTEGLTVKSFAHIKTGSLTEVAGIAGYVTARSGKRMIVVCIVNHAEAGKLREAMDNLLQWVYENG